MSTTPSTTGTAGLTPSLGHATVADVMHHGVFSCPPDATLKDVAEAMAAAGVHAIVVEGVATDDERGERLVWGVASDLDVAAAFSLDTDTVTAAELASTEPVTIRPRDSLTDAARVMTEHGVSHLIVTRSDGAPTGVISTLDLARALAWGVGRPE